MHKKLNGIVIPTVTALDKKGKFDEVSQRRLLTYLIDNGVSGIFALGFTGESTYLSHDVKKEVMDVTSNHIEEIKKRVKRNIGVIVGVSGKDIEETIANVKYASKLPIDGIVLQPSIIPHKDYLSLIKRVVNASQVPIYLYVNPATAIKNKEVITPDNIRSIITGFKGICGLKVSDDFEMLKKYCKALEGTDCSVYIGNAMDLFKVFDGNKLIGNIPIGVITGPGNLFPKEWVRAWGLREVATNEKKAILESFKEFQEMYYHVPSGKKTIPTIKYLLHKKGILSSSRCNIATLTKEDEIYLSNGFKNLD